MPPKYQVLIIDMLGSQQQNIFVVTTRAPSIRPSNQPNREGAWARSIAPRRRTYRADTWGMPGPQVSASVCRVSPMELRELPGRSCKALQALVKDSRLSFSSCLECHISNSAPITACSAALLLQTLVIHLRPVRHKKVEDRQLSN